MTSHISYEESSSKGAFYLEKAGQKESEMTYSRAGKSQIIIDHTEVGDQLRGSGTGQTLVEEAVKWARQNDIKILPLCPFALLLLRFLGKTLSSTMYSTEPGYFS